MNILKIISILLLIWVSPSFAEEWAHSETCMIAVNQITPCEYKVISMELGDIDVKALINIGDEKTISITVKVDLKFSNGVTGAGDISGTRKVTLIEKTPEGYVFRQSISLDGLNEAMSSCVLVNNKWIPVRDYRCDP